MIPYRMTAQMLPLDAILIFDSFKCFRSINTERHQDDYISWVRNTALAVQAFEIDL
jgi:hypothetical protein